MKKTVFFAALLALSAFAETNSIDWRYGKPGVVVITNAPSVARFTGEIARVEGRIDGITLSASDHAALSNLSWTAGGHYGTPARLAGFFEGGMAGYAGFGLGMYLDGDDNIAVSNEIIAGAALGATAIQPSVFIPLADRVSGLEGRSNDWNTAFGWGSHAGLYLGTDSWAQWLSTNTYVKVETDAIALDALATNKVTRWYDPDDVHRWAEWVVGMTNIVIYRAEVSGTNFMVTLSDNFLETQSMVRPAWTNNVFPFLETDWAGTQTVEQATVTFTAGGTVWRTTETTYPLLVVPFTPYAQGTATVSIASFNLTTNVEWRYYLPTNAIPPELQNLDALQGWLNNLYAGKAAFDGHAPAGTIAAPHLIDGDRALIDSIPGKAAINGGVMTNVTLAGTVTLNGQPLLTNAPPGATMTYLTNSFGVTTQQVWTIGGAVSTNFFTSKALVPKTGQTNVYYETGCDGCLKIGFPFPSPRFSLVADTGPATNQVLDNLTGLIWCRDAGRTPTNWVSIFEAVSNMNVEAYAGATDWRLPNVMEMLSLIHFGFSGPAISSLLGSSKGSAGDPFFGVSLATGYATSTTRSANTIQCFTCGLNDGTIGVAAKTFAFGYIPVRGP